MVLRFNASVGETRKFCWKREIDHHGCIFTSGTSVHFASENRISGENNSFPNSLKVNISESANFNKILRLQTDIH